MIRSDRVEGVRTNNARRGHCSDDRPLVGELRDVPEDDPNVVVIEGVRDRFPFALDDVSSVVDDRDEVAVLERATQPRNEFSVLVGERGRGFASFGRRILEQREEHGPQIDLLDNAVYV